MALGRNTEACRRLEHRFAKARSERDRKRIFMAAHSARCGWMRPLGKVDPYGRSRSATLYIGRKRGQERQNQTARCKRLIKRELSISVVDETFISLRCAQVGRKNIGATRRTGAGWYQGEPESSLSYEIVFIPSAREKSYKAFIRNINKLAEKMSSRLCQDSIIIVTDDGDIRSAAGASCPKGTC